MKNYLIYLLIILLAISCGIYNHNLNEKIENLKIENNGVLVGAPSQGTTFAYNLNVSNKTTLSDWIIIPETYGNEMMANSTGFTNCTMGTGWTNQGNFANHTGSSGTITCNLTEALVQNASYKLEFTLFNVTSASSFYIYLGSGSSNANVMDYWVDAPEMKNQSYAMYGYTLKYPGTASTNNKVIQINSAASFSITNVSLKKVNGGTISSKNMTLGQGFLTMGRNTIKFYNYADKVHFEGVCIGTTCENTAYSEDLNVPDGGRIASYLVTTSLTMNSCGTLVDSQTCSATGQNTRLQTYYNKSVTTKNYPMNAYGGVNRTYPIVQNYENMTSLGLTANSGMIDWFYVDSNYIYYYLSYNNLIGGSGWINSTNGKIKTVYYNETSNSEVRSANQIINGNLTANFIFGEMYNFSDTGSTISIATSNAYYNITGLNCGYINGFNCSSSAGTLTTLVPGIYKIDYNLAIETDTADGSYGAGIAKNYANLETQQRCYSRLYTRAGEQHNIGGTCFLNLSVGDTINYMIDDEVIPTRNTLWQTVEFTAVRIGN